MRTGWHIQEAYRCDGDACEAEAVTSGGIPDGWGEFQAMVSCRGAGTPMFTNEALPDVHVCPRCRERGPGILGRRIQELLATPEEEVAHDA